MSETGKGAGFWSTQGRIGALAVVYAVVAKASFCFTIPPGNISPVFPVAGVALAAVLLLGRKALLGVSLGSFAANTISFVDGSVSSGLARPLDLLVGGCIGHGAMAGAAAGSFLVRRFCRGEDPLHSGKNVLVLVLLVGLGCCLISPTVGVMSLALNGKVPWSQFGDSWVTRWVGDASGALNRIPIVAVTSYAMPGDREKALAAGCNGYIEKPIHPDTFVAQVTSFLPRL